VPKEWESIRRALGPEKYCLKSKDLNEITSIIDFNSKQDVS